MPRYLLDHAVTAHAFVDHRAESPPAREGDFGRFWFNGYAVNIRMLPSGKMQAERVIKDMTGVGIRWSHRRTLCNLLQVVWYWLRTRVGAEGGERWTLADRDSADVISQSWSAHRQCSLASHVPKAASGVVPKWADSVAAPLSGLVPEDGKPWPAGIGAAFGATPVLQRVLDYIGINGRLTLVPAGLHAPDALDKMVMRARAIRSAADVKIFVLRFGFGLLSSAEQQLSPSQQGQLLAELVDVVAKLPAAHRGEAMVCLGGVALHLHRSTGHSDVLTVFVQRCIDARLPPSYLERFVIHMKSEPVATTARARFALLSQRDWRENFHRELLPDTAAYTEMIGALTGHEPQQHVHDIMEAVFGRTAEHLRGDLWHDVWDHALRMRETKPAMASRQLAALARFIGSDVPLEPGEHQATWERLKFLRWQMLAANLPTRQSPEFDAAELACQLAIALQGFSRAPATRALGMRMLDERLEAATLTSAQRVRVGLAQLPLRPDESKAALWKALWQRIEDERLNGCAVEAIAQLGTVTDPACWHSVLDYCSDRTKAWPTQRADMLLALIALSESADRHLGVADAQAVRAHIADAALRLLRDGGSAVPLVKCRWMPDAEVMAAIVAHVPWPDRARALTLRLRESAHPWQARDIALLQAQMVELGKRAGKDGHDEMRDAFASLTMAIAERCDAQGLPDPKAWNAMVRLASSLVPAVAAGLDRHGAPGFVAQAALVDSLMQIAATQPDAVRPSGFIGMGSLWDDTWHLLHRLPAADRQPVLDALGDRMQASGPRQLPGRRHCWSEKALQQVLWGLTADVPDRARIVSQMVRAEWQPQHRREHASRFDDLKKRILTEALCLPDEQFGSVVSDMISLDWFASVPTDTVKHRDDWFDAMDVVVRRIGKMPVFQRSALLLHMRMHKRDRFLPV